MALIELAIMSVLIIISGAAINPIKEHPHSVKVTEGQWANFTCGFKLPGNIKWRIGDLTRDGHTYNSAGNLPQLEGATAERSSFVRDTRRRIGYETVEVLATVELDGTAVQCMFVHSSSNAKKNSFSQFALMHVNRFNVSTGSGEI